MMVEAGRNMQDQYELMIFISTTYSVMRWALMINYVKLHAKS
jgi:hypothetical protein